MYCSVDHRPTQWLANAWPRFTITIVGRSRKCQRAKASRIARGSFVFWSFRGDVSPGLTSSTQSDRSNDYTTRYSPMAVSNWCWKALSCGKGVLRLDSDSDSSDSFIVTVTALKSFSTHLKPASLRWMYIVNSSQLTQQKTTRLAEKVDSLRYMVIKSVRALCKLLLLPNRCNCVHTGKIFCLFIVLLIG
jgi:hypothetical protein